MSRVVASSCIVYLFVQAIPRRLGAKEPRGTACPLLLRGPTSASVLVLANFVLLVALLGWMRQYLAISA